MLYLLFTQPSLIRSFHLSDLYVSVSCPKGVGYNQGSTVNNKIKVHKAQTPLATRGGSCSDNYGINMRNYKLNKCHSKIKHDQSMIQTDVKQ